MKRRSTKANYGICCQERWRSMSFAICTYIRFCNLVSCGDPNFLRKSPKGQARFVFQTAYSTTKLTFYTIVIDVDIWKGLGTRNASENNAGCIRNSRAPSTLIHTGNPHRRAQNTTRHPLACHYLMWLHRISCAIISPWRLRQSSLPFLNHESTWTLSKSRHESWTHA